MNHPHGYSKTPLVQKLGIRPNARCLIVNEPTHYFELLGILPEELKFDRAMSGKYDFIHVFISFWGDLQENWDSWQSALKPDGMLWISHPKGNSKLPRDLNQNDIRKFGLNKGLVDVKVCAVDTDWSGIKFVYRLKDR